MSGFMKIIKKIQLKRIRLYDSFHLALHGIAFDAGIPVQVVLRFILSDHIKNYNLKLYENICSAV